MRFSKIATSVLVVAAVAASSALTSATARASTGVNAVYTSNGEAGYYTWAFTPFDENRSFITPMVPGEQMGTDGGIGLQLAALDHTSNVVNLPVAEQTSNPAGIMNECHLAQIGFIWNAAEGQYDVYLAEGTSTYAPTSTNPYLGGTHVNACTSGGALNLASPVTFQDGFTVVTSVVTQVLGGATTGAGISPGNQAFLQLQRIGGVIKGLASDTTATWNSNDAFVPSPFSFFNQPHYAGAGTVFDFTNRAPAAPPAGLEAAFWGLRAANHAAGPHHVLVLQPYNTWLNQEVQSSANGTSSDSPAVTPNNTLNNVTGPGIFRLYVGSPNGA